MRSVLLLSLSLLFLYACGKDGNDVQEALPPEDPPYVTVIHSPNGLGDRGYNDLLYTGIRQCQETCGFHLMSHSPLDMEEAEQLMTGWMADSSATGRRMLVLASSDLEPVLRKHVHQLPAPERGEVLLLESRATDLPVYTLYLPLYGACYQAGCAAMQFPYADISAVVCANPMEGPVADGRRGFEAGFADNGGRQLDLYYLSDDDRGYAMSDSLYRLCYTLEQDHSFVFPLCGGSNQGLLRFTREYPQTFYTAGMDVDQSDYSPRVAFSVVKHIDRAIYQFLAAWTNGDAIPPHQRLGLSSDLVEVTVSPDFADFLGNSIEATRETAMQKEEAYEKTM